MEGCKEVQLNFVSGYYSTSDCSLIESSISSRSSTGYVNISKLTFDRIEGSGSGYLTICKYDSNNQLVSIDANTNGHFSIGSNTINLDPNYKYTFSYRKSFFGNFKAYNCNQAIASMSNELAFGSGRSLFTNLGDLAPLFIVIIGFALGFWFLKKIVRKGQEGKTL